MYRANSGTAHRPFTAILATLLIATLAFGVLHGQTIVTRDVVASGGGTTSSAGHTVRGTVSQTAVGRMARGAGDRHDVGFWYWAYRPTAVTVVAIPRLEAEIGTRVTIPMTLVSAPGATQFLPRAFHARVRFNHTLLHPVAGTPGCDADTGDCVLVIDGVAQPGAGALAQMEFLVALGDSEATPMIIEEFTWEHRAEERIATTREHGELKLLGVCREGGVIRTIRSGAFASRVRVAPNPAHGRIVLEYVSAEDGPVDVRLVDLLGNDVARLVGSEVEAERLYRAEIDLEAIASGSYVLVYRTPSQVLTERLLITQ